METGDIAVCFMAGGVALGEFRGVFGVVFEADFWAVAFFTIFSEMCFR